MTEDKRALMIENTARNIEPVTENVKLRHCAHCLLADPEYGRRLAEALKLDLKKVEGLAKMTHAERLAATARPG